MIIVVDIWLNYLRNVLELVFISIEKESLATLWGIDLEGVKDSQ